MENPPWLLGVMLAAATVFDKIPQSLISLAARIFPAAVFWMSGRTKVEGFHVTDNAIALFRDEYALPRIDPALAANIAAFSEHFFPFLLVIGLASRLSALALLGMTAVIEIFVYPGAWPTHGVWAAAFSSSSRAGRASFPSTILLPGVSPRVARIALADSISSVFTTN